MSWIDLGIPRPREVPIPYTPVAWSSSEKQQLANPSDLPNVSFADVVLSRRSRRLFNQTPELVLSTFFWLSCRTQNRYDSNLGFPLAQRPAPSAGAIHPIHVLINQASEPGWWRYDHDHHSLNLVEHSDSILSGARTAAETLLTPGEGALMLLVAEPGKTFAKYSDPCGLIWRDTGVLLGQFSLVSEALGLNFCILGITGEPWAGRLDPDGRLAGVGMAVVGSPM